MTKRLLIDASHAEETRVVVLDGNRLEDFDVETLSRRQLKGNIYLAKVVRVEPSLQAAFVEYGGNRHGFLAFGEIHPDYYQIPVADRQRLLELQEEEARAEEEEDDGLTIPQQPSQQDDIPAMGEAADVDPPQSVDPPRSMAIDSAFVAGPDGTVPDEADPEVTSAIPELPGADILLDGNIQLETDVAQIAPENQASEDVPDTGRVRQVDVDEAPAPETVGGGDAEAGEEARPARQSSRFTRSYKIQEVIRRRQILLIQVVKEERGTKGAALTTYISLAGRYCVLMPNSPRGGGISRKITSAADRRRLKEVTAELGIPRGMGLIVRTAGAARPKPEIMRDGEYLLRLWDDVRERTMQSMAPALIHEEASLIKRTIRDVYSRDVDELLVDGEAGWRAARDYMRMLMPTHVKKVQLWPANAQPLFAHSQVEALLDGMLNPTVQLRSGGYLVINQAEALVAIDVNSGRSTRERGIEETALRTNLEAAEEAARQLRLRDLAGLIVIDFIDMESKKHNAMVERRMADALKNDRARIQIGHISHFGLLELSRQRLRPSLAETSLSICTVCGGTGHIRSTESAALHVLREIEEEGGRRRAAEIMVHLAGTTALYILNNKRQRLTEIEARYGMRVCFEADASLLIAQTRIERLRVASPDDLPALSAPQAQPMPDDDAGEADIGDDEDDLAMPQGHVEAEASLGEAVAGDFTTDADHVPGETAAEGERRRRRRRRRRGGRRDTAMGEASPTTPDSAEQPDLPEIGAGIGSLAPLQADADAVVEEAVIKAGSLEPAAVVPPGDSDAEQGRAKRGRRGGRRRRKPGEDIDSAPPAGSASGDETITGAHAFAPAIYPAPIYPTYVGPTPADPFALGGLDIFDVLERAEQSPSAFVVAEAPQPPAEMDPLPEMTAVGPESPMLNLEPPMAVKAMLSDSGALPEPEPVAGVAAQPTLIGSGATMANSEPKKGWWRR